jgi:hypothetical protein
MPEEFLSRDDRRALAAVIALYCVATWWYAIPFGLVWDDHVLLAHSASSLLSVASEAGRADQAFLILPFQASKAPWTWALVAWLSLGAANMFIFMTVRRIRGTSVREAFWIAALTATAPFFQARFALSVLPYAVSALCFTASLFLLVVHLDRPNLGCRIGSLVLLLLACSTSSFLTLYWIPSALIAWHTFAEENNAKARVTRSVRAAFSYPEFIFLPAVLFLVRRWLFPAHGLYANYYTLKVTPIAAVRETVAVLWAQIGDLPRIFSVFLPNWNLATILEAVLPAGCILLLGYFALRSLRRQLEPDAPEPRRMPWPVRLGLLALAMVTPILALYPYIVVQQPPRFPGLWETRHQLTLMLVSASVLVCMVRCFSGQRSLNVIAAFFLFLFLAQDYAAGRQFLVDRLEYRELAHKLAADPLPPQSLVLIVERNREFRMFGRFFAFYELNHLASRADGQTSRLVVSNREILDPQTNTHAVEANPPVVVKMLRLCSLRGRPEFGFSGFSYNGRATAVSIDPQIDRISLPRAIYLTVSGEQTDWIKLSRKTSAIDVPGCSPE